jgi:hypothetical protein
LLGLVMKLKRFNVHLYNSKTFMPTDIITIEADGLMSALVIAKNEATKQKDVYVGKVEAQ